MFFWKCAKQNFAERLRKPTRTAQVGYAEHGSKSSIEVYLRGGYAVTRRLREGYADHTFAYAEAQVSQKAQLIFASYHPVI